MELGWGGVWCATSDLKRPAVMIRDLRWWGHDYNCIQWLEGGGILSKFHQKKPCKTSQNCTRPSMRLQNKDLSIARCCEGIFMWTKKNFLQYLSISMRKLTRAYCPAWCAAWARHLGQQKHFYKLVIYIKNNSAYQSIDILSMTSWECMKLRKNSKVCPPNSLRL